MTRREFIRELDQYLVELPDKERLDILADHTEIFLSGVQQGKTEEEIAVSLGSPARIAGQILASYQVTRQQTPPSYVDPTMPPPNPTESHPVRSVLIALLLGFVNLVFVLGPYIGVLGVLIGLFAAACALLFTPVILVANIVSPVTQDVWAFTLFGSLAAGGLGVLLAIGLFYLSKWFFRLTVMYLKLNLKLIRGE